jgi:PucR family transcriptional regulator, purine catabolism regulatory protein
LITVEQVLGTHAFKASKTLGGFKGLQRNVSTVTVAEVPDAANWLRGGELVCTTAYFISKGIKYQIEWIKSLVDNGASALAIKTSRFLGQVPESIINIADHLNFPIIEMPSDITWPSVIESVMNLLLDVQNNILRKAEEVNTALTSLVLEGESVQTIADKIANLVGNPIIIEDTRLNLIVTGNCHSIDEEKYQKLVESRTGQDFKEKVLTSSFYQNVLLNRSKEKLRIRLSSEKTAAETVTVPILSNRMVYGFITIIEANKELSQFDIITLDHGSTALALQFMKQIIHDQTLRTRTASMIDDLVNGRFHTELINEFHLYNYDWSMPIAVAVAEINGGSISEESYAWDVTNVQLTEKIQKHLLKHFDHIIVGRNDTTFNILASFQNSKVSAATSTLRNELSFILAECKDQNLINSYFVGIGSPQDDLQQVGKSYKQALSAKSIAKSFQRKGPIVLYEDLGMHRIISMIHNRKELMNFCNDFLAELDAYDKQNKDVLKETLYVYLQCGGIVQETAKQMFVHPNTISYRLKKIQNVIKHDLNSWEVRFTYLFALEAAGILNTPFDVLSTEQVF